jgi:hypothetical protein
MEYKIVTAKTTGELERRVNEYIREGWQPLGGVCAWSGGMMVMQARLQSFYPCLSVCIRG